MRLLTVGAVEVTIITGRLQFPETDSRLLKDSVEPLAGRVVLISAGSENGYYVEKVTEGGCFWLSFHFTCDERREFKIFPDGRAHSAFAHAVKQRLYGSARGPLHAKYRQRHKPG
jgi:hypothetical protein